MNTRTGFFNLRILIGLFVALTGVFLVLACLGAFSPLTASIAHAQQKIIINPEDPLVTPGFDCSKIHELGIDKQVNLRARAIIVVGQRLA